MKELKKTVYYISFPLAFIGFIFPIYATSVGISIMEVGYLYSIFSIVSIIIRPLVGNFIDKRGRKIGILIGVILYSAVNGVFIVAVDFKHLLIARILQSFATSFLWISVDSYISDISDKINRSKNFGIIDQSISKGGLLGSIIGFTALFSKVFNNPYQIIFTIFLCTSLISLYNTIKSVRETIHFKKDNENRKLIDRKVLKYFLVVIGTISLINNLTAPIYLLYLKENITSDLGFISHLFVPAAMLSTFLPSKFGAMADKYGREKIVLIGMSINSILQIFIPFNRSYYNFMALYTLISVVGMFYGPAFSSLIIDLVGEDRRGRSYGLYNFSSGIGAAIGPIIGSYIYERIGNDIVFYVKGVLLVAITTLLCYLYTMVIRPYRKVDNRID